MIRFSLILFCYPFFCFAQIRDVENNTYDTARIGNKVWMTENLRVTSYNDSTSIPLIVPSKTWSELTKPAYCIYENKVENLHTYGVLYNWFVVEKKNVCPVNWHVATDKDWQELIEFYDGEQLAGLSLKGTQFWLENGFGLNESQFSALPGGGRKYTGVYDFLNQVGIWWSANEEQIPEGKSENAITFQMTYWNNNAISWFNKKQEGYSIRCVKD